MAFNESEHTESATTITLSKNQLKKQRRHQRWIDGKTERRKLEKEKRSLKRKKLAQNRDNGTAEPVSKPPAKVLMVNSSNKFRVVIDMDFEGYMTEKEIAKSAKQAGRIYCVNRHSENPCQLYFSSLKGTIRDRFAITNAGYQNWDANFSELDYVKLFEDSDECTRNEDSALSKFVYLTGDAEISLPDVDTLLQDKSKIFIIGGLVDHNRHKNLCLRRAQERGIQVARLPIKGNLTLCQRHILSTVNVFEIMLYVLGSHKLWPEALLAAIPKRKVAPDSRQIRHDDQATTTGCCRPAGEEKEESRGLFQGCDTPVNDCDKKDDLNL